MKSLSRLVRAILWGVLIGWAVALLRRMIFAQTARQTPVGAQPKSAGPLELHRDPVCGTYVSPEVSFTLEQAGHLEHFCSAACRDRFLLSRQRAMSA